MEQSENSDGDIDKNVLVEKLVVFGEKIDNLGGYGSENSFNLVKLCDEFEAFFDDLIAVNESNIQTIAFGYGEDVRRDCEWSTKTPNKKENYSFIADRYNRGKRHLKHEVDLFIHQLKR